MAEFGLLVVGAGRSGTSLIGAMLDAHPCLEVALEAHSIDLLDQATDSRERARRYREECEEDARNSAAQLWGNKITTEQIHALKPRSGVEPLELFFDELGDVPVIFIVRDGRACVDSKVRRAGMSYENAAYFWRFSVEALRYVHARGALIVSFEQLVTESEPVLRKVCDFLRLPFSDRMYGGTTSPKLTPAYRREDVDPSRAAIPAVPAEIHDAIRDDLRSCGYVEERSL